MMARARAAGPGARVLGWCRRPEVIAAVVAVVPIAAAIVRALATHWLPVQDNAIIEIRSRDVASLENFPLLGTWSSASLTAGVDLNHPGPLLFDLLAPFVWAFGGGPGIAIGIGMLNAASVIGCALVAFRVGGRSASLAASVVAGLLAWTLGSSLLIDPWNPHPVMLPCLLMLMLTWGVASGHLGMAPWLLAVASLCLQVHLGYAYLVPGCVLMAAVGATVVSARRWRADPGARRADLSRCRRIGAVSMLVVSVLWAQPLVEQFFGAGQGNLARIVSSAGGDEPVIGSVLAVRLVAAVTAMPPWWGRSSFTEAIEYAPMRGDGTVVATGLPGAAVSFLAVAVVLVALGMLAALAWRSCDRVAAVLAVVASVLLCLAVVALAVSPFGPLGLTPHQMRWLWSVGAFVAFALLVGCLRATAGLVRDRNAAAVAWGMVSIVALVAVLDLPASVQPAGPTTFVDQFASARALRGQMLEYRPAGAVVVATDDLRFGEIYSTVVMSALDEAGVEVRVADEGWVRQLGEARRVAGDEVVELRIAEGEEALTQRPDAVRVALVQPDGDPDLRTVAVFATVLGSTVSGG
jgi:hypothetical protein